MSLLTSDYDYALPDALIARHPSEKRDAARMMVLHRAEQRIEHRTFRDFPGYLRAGDLVVLNDTRVIPARAFSDHGNVELLFLEALGPTPHTWKCLVKPGRRMRVGATVSVGGVLGTVINIEPDGERVIGFENAVDLDRVGELPLPPYFERRPDAADATRYQTVFARESGSVAAPTAGLHFDDNLLTQLQARGINIAHVTLHVGAGTFQPVRVQNLAEHRMHSERYSLPQTTVDAIAATRQRGGRIVAVGTTSLRTLESAARSGALVAGSGDTDLFITPGFKFAVVDMLITNFHLPKSTLLMLVSAFGGSENIRAAYRHAIATGYRFFSYGDAMLIHRHEI